MHYRLEIQNYHDDILPTGDTARQGNSRVIRDISVA